MQANIVTNVNQYYNKSKSNTVTKIKQNCNKGKTKL